MSTNPEAIAKAALASRWTLGLLQLLVVLFVGSTFSTTATTGAVGVVGLAIGILGRRGTSTGMDGSSGTWLDSVLLLGGVLGVLAWIPAWRFFPVIQTTSSVLPVIIDTLAHLAAFLSMVLWLVRPSRGHVMMLVLGMLSIMMAVAGGGVSTTTTSQTAVALATAIGFVIASQAILSGAMRQATTTIPWKLVTPLDSRIRSGWFSGSRPIATLWLVVVLTLTSAMVSGTQRVLPQLQSRVFASLKDQFEESDIPSWVSGTRYVQGNRLGSIRSLMLADPQAVALRGYGDMKPGYLRGHVFDFYKDRRWTSRRRWETDAASSDGRRTFELARLQPIGEAVTPVRSPTQRTTRRRQRFALMSATGRDESGGFVTAIEIEGDPAKGSTTFLPLTAGWVETPSAEIAISVDRLVARGVDPARSYVAGVMRQCETETLTDLDRRTTLALADDFRQRWKGLAEQVTRGSDSAADKARDIADFFQSEFEYSMQPVENLSRQDPIDFLLQQRHPAHCELFASAATLLLRCVDVPSRYVTGYVMDELGESDDTYLARNADAHAWVEYFDEASQRWQPLEPTPGRTYQTPRPDEFENLDLAFLANDDDDRDGAAETWWRSMLGSWSSVRATDSLVIVFRWLQVPALFVLCWVFWRQRRGVETDQIERDRVQARRQMDRLMRRYQLVRRPSETLHQFADRIEQSIVQPTVSGSAKVRGTNQSEVLASAARWYRCHATTIYRPVADTTQPLSLSSV